MPVVDRSSRQPTSQPQHSPHGLVMAPSRAASARMSSRPAADIDSSLPPPPEAPDKANHSTVGHPRGGDLGRHPRVVGPNQIEEQRRLLTGLQHVGTTLLRPFLHPPVLRRRYDLSEVAEHTEEFPGVRTGKGCAMNEPVETGYDCDGEIG